MPTVEFDEQMLLVFESPLRKGPHNTLQKFNASTASGITATTSIRGTAILDRVRITGP